MTQRKRVLVRIPLGVPDDMDPDDFAFAMAATAEEMGATVGRVRVEGDA